VTKVHREAVRFARDDFEILLIGHDGHEEVEGTAGEAPTTSPSSTRPRKPTASS
jgi:4-hydroxy-3-methylbut-2-enyl diphosphate reductase IspH